MRRHVYECDRCHRSESVPVGDTPEGWEYVRRWASMTATQLIESFTEALKGTQSLQILCPSCVASNDEWWARGVLDDMHLKDGGA